MLEGVISITGGITSKTGGVTASVRALGESELTFSESQITLFHNDSSPTFGNPNIPAGIRLGGTPGAVKL